MEIRGVDSSHVPAGNKHSINWITKEDSHSLFVWPGAGNDLYIFKGLLIIIKKVIETICGPQSLKDLLFGPLQGKFATSGVEERAGHSAAWEGPWVVARSPAAVHSGDTPAPLGQTPGLSGGPHFSPSPGLASLERPTSPTQAWSLWRKPPTSPIQASRFGGLHFPCPLHGPSELVLPANTCCVDERLSQPPPWPRPADPVPGYLPAQPAPPCSAHGAVRP